MSPRPSTRVPLVQMATLRPIIVKRPASCGNSAIASHTRATPGVYTSRTSWLVRISRRPVTSSLPPSWAMKARS